MNFDEYVFLWTMINRPYYCNSFANTWDVSWLKDITLAPVLDSVFDLYKKFNKPPSIKVISEYMTDKHGAELFKARYEEIINKIIELSPDDTDVGYTLEKAREVSITRSFENLSSSLEYSQIIEKKDGKQLLKTINAWLGKFVTIPDEETLSIEEAVSRLITEGSKQSREPISSGITAIDDFTAGGLRAGQLGIFVAPTGQGKSTILMNIAYRTSLIDTCDTWFVSNELTMAEQTERFLSRMTGIEVSKIQNDPYSAYETGLLDKHWTDYKIQDRLTLTTILKSFSAKDLEASLMKRKAITGWSPKLLVLDYIERMTPNNAVYGEQEWRSLGRIAGDLIQFGKRHGIAIWTAAQTNRAGLKDNVELTMDMGQSSIRHFQEASYVITLQKHPVPGDDGQEVFKLKVEKSRHARNTNRAVFLRVDLDKMLVTDEKIEFSLPTIQPNSNTDKKGGRFKTFD